MLDAVPGAISGQAQVVLCSGGGPAQIALFLTILCGSDGLVRLAPRYAVVRRPTSAGSHMAGRSRRPLSMASARGSLSMHEAERRHIMHALMFAHGRVEGGGGAAVLLGMKPSTLRSRMAKAGITRAAALLLGLPRVSPATWTMAAMQTRHISNALAVARGRVEGAGGAADLLGLKPSTLRTRMIVLGISRKPATAGAAHSGAPASERQSAH